MPLVVRDRVKETTSTTGTGSYTLSGAVAGFQSFSVIGNGNTTFYAISGNSDWEVGIGTYSTTGPTLARTTILESSNAGNAVNWGAGIKDIFCTYPAERSLYIDGSTITPAISSTLPALYGGTGLSSPGTAGNVLTSTGSGWTSSTPATPSEILFGTTNFSSVSDVLVAVPGATLGVRTSYKLILNIEYFGSGGTLSLQYANPSNALYGSNYRTVFSQRQSGSSTITNTANNANGFIPLSGSITVITGLYLSGTILFFDDSNQGVVSGVRSLYSNLTFCLVSSGAVSAMYSVECWGSWAGTTALGNNIRFATSAGNPFSGKIITYQLPY